MIELVVFDLGGVLIEIVEGWRHAHKRAGVEVSAKMDEPGLRELLLRGFRDHELGILDESEFMSMWSSAMVCTKREALSVYEAWLIGPHFDIASLLIAIKERGVSTACLSNTNETHWRAMSAPSGPVSLPLNQFDFCFASHLMGMRKPSAKIYHHLCEVTQADPTRVLFFDDRLENVKAARYCGWEAVLIGDKSPGSEIRGQLARYGVLRGG